MNDCPNDPFPPFDWQSQQAQWAAQNAEWAADRAASEAKKARREARKTNLLQLISLAQNNQLDPKLQEQLERLIRAEAEQVERENSWTPRGCASVVVVGGFLILLGAIGAHFMI